MLNGKHAYVAEYLLGIKNWMIRKMAGKYILACEKFKKNYASVKNKIDFPFDDLDDLSDILYEIKEDHHLVFKRVVGPDKIKNEDRHKIDPAQPEINFITNVGRLFHKTLVARELKYLHKHYDPLNNGDSDAAFELEQQIEQLKQLFDVGIEVLIELMQLHSSNVQMLALIVENDRNLRKSIGMTGQELLKRVTGQVNPEATYYLTGKYYMEGGWYARAEQMFKRILKANPKHAATRLAMDEIKMVHAKKMRA